MITTDYEFEGFTLNLIFRTKKSLNDKYSEWKVKQSFNPLEDMTKASKIQEEIQFNLNNMYVELPENMVSTGAVHKVLKEALHNKAVFLTMDAQSKKEATMKFENTEEAKKAETALKERFSKDLKLMIIQVNLEYPKFSFKNLILSFLIRGTTIEYC